MSNNIFRNVPNERSVTVNFERLKGLGQNITKKHDAETQEDIKDTKPEIQTVSLDQVQALLGINRKEHEPKDEIITTLKSMILQKRILSGSQKSKITPYEDYQDENGEHKKGFKTKSINHIINIYNLEKWKGEGTLDIASIINEFIENGILSEKNGNLSGEEIVELQSIKDTILKNIKEFDTTKNTQVESLEEKHAVAENVEMQETDSDEVDEVDETKQIASQQPMEQPVEPTAQSKIKQVESLEEKHAVAKNVEMQETDSDEVDKVDETKQIALQQPMEQPVEPTAQPEIKQVESLEEKHKVAKDVEVKDVITIERPKTRFSKAISIDIPNTTNPKTSVVYTYAQYTIPEGLKVKPLGVQSLAKHKDSFNMNSLVCLNRNSDHPLYAMELNDSNKLNKKLGKLNSSGETVFVTAKLFGKTRLIYRKNVGGTVKNYVVVDQSITKKYATNQYAQEKICCENEREIQLGQVLSPLTPTATAIAKTEKALCEQIKTFTPAVFKGTILPQDSQTLLKLLGLDINQTFQANKNGEILTEDGVKTGVGSNIDKTTGKLVNFCTLSRGDDKKLPGLKNLKNSLNNLDISGSLETNEEVRRSRFIIFIKGNCLYLKSENDLILINIPALISQNGIFENFGEEQNCNFCYEAQNQYKTSDKAPKTVTISTTNEYKQACIKAYITNILKYEHLYYTKFRPFKKDVSELVNNTITALETHIDDKEQIEAQFKIMKNFYLWCNNDIANKTPSYTNGLLDKCFWLYTYNQYNAKPSDRMKEYLNELQQNPSCYINNLIQKFNNAYNSDDPNEMIEIAYEFTDYYYHILEIMQSLSPQAS